MQANYLYHIFNRGNNSQKIYFTDANYSFFAQKIKKHLLPHFHLLAFCLMPNHFHFLVFTKEHFNSKNFYNDYRIMLSSYTRAVNKQEQRTGSLFQQNSKFKLLENNDKFYPLTCFNYIHQNPLKAKICNNLEEYKYSSYPTYISNKKTSFVSKDEAYKFLDVPSNKDEFIEMTKMTIADEDLRALF